MNLSFFKQTSNGIKVAFKRNSIDCFCSPNSNSHITYSNIGFTIVELLVVIVVIGILAAITIISYTGLSGKANVASLQSDLSSAKKQLALYQVEHSTFPTSLTADGNKYCPTGGTEYCFKTSTGNTFTYSSPVSPYQTYIMDAINTVSSTKYRITNDSAPESAMPTDTVTIGTQTWMKYNLDVGSMITGGADQTNNSLVEKWCYNNNPANCSIYGGFYQWGETVQYQDGASNTTSPNPAFSTNVQGIAPAGFHIPSDAEYKILEMSLGMSQAQADIYNAYRGTTEGDQLKSAGLCQGRTPCGTSGFNALLGGDVSSGTWGGISTYEFLWSSSQDSASYAYRRSLEPSRAQVFRYPWDSKAYGFSVRALKN